MPTSLSRKVGPLKMYQWIGLGVIAGLGVLIYRRSHAPAPEGEVFGGTGTGAFGPINPETGVPYAFEGGGSAGANPAASLSEQLGGLGELIGTLRELGLWPEGAEESQTAAEDQAGAGAKRPKKDAKSGKAGSKGKNKAKGAGKGGKKAHTPATSTGAGAAAGGHKHTSAPHPKHRIGVAANHPAGRQRNAIHYLGGSTPHAIGNTPSHRQPTERGSGASRYHPPPPPHHNNPPPAHHHH